MKILNLGWGVQSFTLAAMVAVGELEPVTAAIHADTSYEHAQTYEFRQRQTPWLQTMGVRVITVQDVGRTVLATTAQPQIPAFTKSPSGERGMLRRTCTDRWKVRPIEQWIRQELQRANLTKSRGIIEQWIGISLDEAERMRPNRLKYIATRWPLIEKRMTRSDCIAWLTAHRLETPPKSACVFCPFQSPATWLKTREKGGTDWAKAIAIDNTIRDKRPPYQLFVHPNRVPLTEIRSQQDNGQLEMNLWSEECSGVCGV